MWKYYIRAWYWGKHIITSERRKADILKSISLNPTEIKIKQIVKVLKDGYFDEEEKEYNLTVRIYQQRKSNIEISSGTIGTAYKSKSYGMLADYEANLEVDPQNAIEFDSIYGHMKMIAVYPQIIKDELCGYQVDLERIR